MSNNKDYKVTVKVRNNRIIRAIEESGGTLGQKWCDKNNLPYRYINDLINLKQSPLDEEGFLRPIAQKLCDILNKIPEDLWSKEQIYPLEKNFSEIQMSHEEIVSLLPFENQHYLIDESRIENEQTKKVIDNVLSYLTKKEQIVLSNIYHDDMTLEKVGKNYLGGVSKERVRQIQQKALRKLRTRKDLKCILIKLTDDRETLNHHKRYFS